MIYLPFASNGLSVQWDWMLIDSKDMSVITDLNVHSRTLQMQLNSQNKATGWVHLMDDAVDAIVPHQTGLRIDRDGETVYTGAIWQANDTSSASGVGQQSGDDQCAITSFGWFNVLGTGSYNGRLVHTGAEFQAMVWQDYPTDTIETANYAEWKTQNGGNDYVSVGIDTATQLAYSATQFPTTTDAAIIFDLLDRANIDDTTYMSSGQLYGVAEQRNLTLQRLQWVGQQIISLVNVEAGVDFIVDPVTRQMNLYGVGASSSPLIANGYGEDRGQGCLFSYPGNCTSVSRSKDGTQTQNRIEAVGQYDIGRADDYGSQAANGLLEGTNSLSEVVDPNILVAYAQAQVAVLRYPWEILTFTPRGIIRGDLTTPGVPRPFDDYNLGDIVYAYVDRGKRLQIGTNGSSPQATRLFGFTVNIDDNGHETVTQVITTYQGLGILS